MKKKNLLKTETKPLRENTREQLIAALMRADKRIERLQVSQRKSKESQKTLERLTHELRERVKELNCLYTISSIIEKKNLSFSETLQEIVDVIPSAWQYPEITCGRIAVQNHTVATKSFRETIWKQSQDITADGSIVGFIEVYYLDDRPERDEGPFLKEERSLLNVIAERIGKITERQRAEEALRLSEVRNTALLNAVPDLMFQIDRNGTIVAFHEGSFSQLRHFREDFIGKNIYVIADEKKFLSRRIIDKVMAYVKTTLSTGRIQVFEQHVPFDGRRRDFEVRMVVSNENEVLGMVRDITFNRRLEREILEISGREQRRIGQDLHDSLCQHLAGIGFFGKVIEKKLLSGIPIEPSDAAEIVNLIDQAITMTRSFARGLNPVRLEADGFMHALNELATNAEKLFKISCTVEYMKPVLIYDDATSTHLYRIVQEALNNAIKHGKADRVTISLTGDKNITVLMIKDNGIGFTKSHNQGKGMGLNIMRYRASMIGASLEIKDCEDRGTMVVCSFQNKYDTKI